MESNLKKISAVFSFAAILLAANCVSAQTTPVAPSGLGGSSSSTEATLQQLIEIQSSQIKQIEAQKQALQTKLDQISESKNSLSQEVQSLNYQISQLDLQIQSNQLASKQLSLEIQSSTASIATIQDEIVQRKAVIAKLMVEIQQSDNSNLLFTVLSSDTLADSLSKTSSLYLLNKSLVDSLSQLADLENQLSDNITTASVEKEKKQEAQINLANVQGVLQDQKQQKDAVLSVTKNQAQVYQDQMDQLNEQQLQISQVIEGIEGKLRASFNPNLLPSKVHGMLSFPVDNVIVTQGYGYTKFAERAYKTDFHTGVDFGVTIGTPVYAAADGVVLRVDSNDRGVARWNRYQYGRYILINHVNNLSTLYAHLSKALVAAGDIIKRGQLIGYSGNTGYTFGPHLHFGVYYTPDLQLKAIPPARGLVPVGVTVDPLTYLPDSGITYDE